MKKLKQNKGITLIVLVITIIILLILTGIIISSIAGNGLFLKAKQARIKERYTSAKEKVNIELMAVQIDCEERKKEYNIKEIAIYMRESKEITIEKYYNKEIASVKEGIEINEIGLEAIVVSVDKYSEYKFLIGESTKIEGVLLGNVDDAYKTEFINIEEFEKDLFNQKEIGARSKLTYTAEPDDYTNEVDSIKVSIKISNAKGIKTIILEDGSIIECNGEREFLKDYPQMVNGTYTYIITDVDGNTETKRMTINLIDKKPPKEFMPEVRQEGNYLIITENSEDSEADEVNSKSGIDYYEYYVYDGSKEVKYETNKIPILTAGELRIYVKAYDKAGNCRNANDYIYYQVSLVAKDMSLEKGEKCYFLDLEGCLWQSNWSGGKIEGSFLNGTKPTRVEGIAMEKKFTKLFKNGNASTHFAVDTDGTLWGWGYDYRGYLLGAGTGRYQMREIPIGDSPVKELINNGNHIIALNEKGEVWSWGHNSRGEVNAETTSEGVYPPVKINIPTALTQVRSVCYGGIGLDIDGNLWAWGSNVNGEIGTGLYSSDSLPKMVNIPNEKFIRIWAGNYSSFALDSSGYLWSTGYNQKVDDDGNIGYCGSSFEFNKISNQIKFKDVYSGMDSTVAIDENGDVYSWGENYYGQLGRGNEIGSKAIIGKVEINNVAKINELLGMRSLEYDGCNHIRWRSIYVGKKLLW